MNDRIHNPSTDQLRDLLVGKSITDARLSERPSPDCPYGQCGYLTLSDGTTLKVWGNEGCGGCDSGRYLLRDLNEVENIIMNVEVEESPASDYVPCAVCGYQWCRDHNGHYRIFVLAEHRRVTLASFEGTDGNGYYGTGWWMVVSPDLRRSRE